MCVLLAGNVSQDEHNLLYVAVTRAKHALQMSPTLVAVLRRAGVRTTLRGGGGGVETYNYNCLRPKLYHDMFNESGRCEILIIHLTLI